MVCPQLLACQADVSMLHCTASVVVLRRKQRDMSNSIILRLALSSLKRSMNRIRNKWSGRASK